MTKLKLKDILKKGCKLTICKVSTKEVNDFIEKYDKANANHYKQVEMRSRSLSFKDLHTPMSI